MATDFIVKAMLNAARRVNNDVAWRSVRPWLALTNWAEEEAANDAAEIDEVVRKTEVNLTVDEVERMAAEFYERVGRPFTSRELADYFNAKYASITGALSHSSNWTAHSGGDVVNWRRQAIQWGPNIDEQ